MVVEDTGKDREAVENEECGLGEDGVVGPSNAKHDRWELPIS